jgi:hypothetical protein
MIEISFIKYVLNVSVHRDGFDEKFAKAMTGGGFPTDSPTFKISMREYEDMAIKVGDKITIEINKSDSSGR